MSVEHLAHRVVQCIQQAPELYHRLVLVVAPPGSGKTTALQHVHEHTGKPLLNANLELSRQLLELTERQRSLGVPKLIDGMVKRAESDVILLDNIEILFDTTLKQDPLRLLQGISRNRTIVVAWSGTIESEYLFYAVPEHQEYRRYPVRDFLVVSPEVTA